MVRLVLVKKAVEIHRRLLGDDHLHTTVSLNNLAFNLDSQAKFVEAEKLYEKVLESRLRLLTENHVLTALIYNNLAANLNDQGKFVRAQAMYEKAIGVPDDC